MMLLLKNLLYRKARTLLTIFGIGIGVMSVVALGAMAEGLLVNYSNLIGSGADLLVTQKNAMDVSYSSLDPELENRLLALPNVEVAEPGVFGWVATGKMPFFLIFGYESHSQAIRHYRIIEGKPVTAPGQIAIGARAAQALGKDIGDTLRIYGVPYHIVGIYETGQAMEESGGVLVLSEAQKIVGKGRKVSLFQLRLHRIEQADDTIARIRQFFSDLSVSRASEFNEMEQWVGLIKGLAWGIALIAVIIGGLGMMNAMVMSVFERTREIGVLRALGWRRRQVLSMILGESLLLSLSGGVVGILLAIGVTRALATIPAVGTLLEGRYTPSLFIQGLVTALMLGMVGGAYPAWRAANLTPVEALRYEGGSGGGRRNWFYRLGGMTWRNLWRRRTRTLLTLGGIGIGVAVLVALGAITEGYVVQLNQVVGSGGTGDLTIMQNDVPDMSLSTIDERTGRAIAGMPQVKNVSGMVIGFVSTPELPLFIVTGLDPNESAIRHYKITEGRLFRRPNEIILGRTAAEALKKRVGETIELYDNRYRIVGIYETGVAWEEGGGVLALREAQRLFNRPRQVSFYLVDVKEDDQAEAVRQMIMSRFPELRVSLSSEFAQNTEDIKSTLAMIHAIMVLAFLIGGVVVTNTMVMTVYERTREIGTLRALGWQQQRILGVILREALLLALVSGVVGALMGVGLTELSAKIPAASAFIQGSYPPRLFVQALGMAVALGLIGGLYPAWRATRLQPVEALRYE
ncbi:MAG TPA: ABC transporter permease [Anaerolineae bacterium]|nr:ABC transporter permease [Anaerolineae bacterium]HIQ06077.1 ABC transporter permease [Anaerolineae bacterium]